MDLRIITDQQKNQYNKLVTHVIQSWEWGEFRKSLGTPVLRYGIYNNGRLSSAFQLTLHQIPFAKKFVGYLPKDPLPNKEFAQALEKIGKENNCAFIKIEPNVILNVSEGSQDFFQNQQAVSFGDKSGDSSPSAQNDMVNKSFIRSPKPLFTKYNFILDLTKSEDQLLKDMHPKTRYNIRIAQKHGVEVKERIDDEAFKIYLKLYFETTKRQGYLGHNENYHRKVWETLKKENMATLLIATLKNEPLTAWMLLKFKDTLYYPYGGSSLMQREAMANNLVAWEAIKLGQKLGLKKFDMWGALGPNANPKDPWFGFHKFKQGYGGELVEYIGTFDLVFNWPIYILFTIIDKLTPLKLFLLKILGK